MTGNAGGLALAVIILVGYQTFEASVGTGREGSSGQVHARFDLTAPSSGPFPSDWFTAADPSHNTGLRVTLPKPDCLERPSDCEDIEVLNTLDGFNLQPRLSIPFDGPIDVETATSATIFLLRLTNTLHPGDLGDQIVGINQVVWDPDKDTLHVESDELLDQHTRYALIVTRGVQDSSGVPIEATETFRRFRQTVRGDYKHALLEAIHAARRVGVREEAIAVASVFTTQSVTAILEKIRDQIKAVTPEPADFLLGPERERTVFELNEVRDVIFTRQNRVDPPGFLPDLPLDLTVLRQVIPGVIGRVAFGKYLSPDYEVHPGEYIPPVGTRTGTPEVQGTHEIYFNLFLPSGPTPAGGWPVAIYGHGNTNNKNVHSLNHAASMAAQGIATIVINAVGHGFGSLSTLTVNQTAAVPLTFPAGGRGIDQNRDNVIGNNEGVAAAPPRTLLSRRDGVRQTVADLLQLVRVLDVGMDVDGDGTRDLDPSRIYFRGESFGGNYGAALLALDPSVRAGVLTVGSGGWVSKGGRLSPGNRPGSALAARVPALINAPGITDLDGVPVSPGPHFHENLPLRDGIPLTIRLEDGSNPVIRSPVVNVVPGAMAIQDVLDNGQWATLAGHPLAYAPHFRKAPLRGVPVRPVIVQFARGDQSANEPSVTAIIRAGDLADRTLYYRNDLAFAEDPTIPRNPHGFMSSVGSTNALVREIALGAQRQIAVFFASDGTEVIHPEPARFFEVPIVLPLPEALNFIPSVPR